MRGWKGFPDLGCVLALHLVWNPSGCRWRAQGLAVSRLHQGPVPAHRALGTEAHTRCLVWEQSLPCISGTRCCCGWTHLGIAQTVSGRSPCSPSNAGDGRISVVSANSLPLQQLALSPWPTDPLLSSWTHCPHPRPSSLTGTQTCVVQRFMGREGCSSVLPSTFPIVHSSTSCIYSCIPFIV